MAGLSLGGGLRGGVGLNSGPYTPLTPASAVPPTQTIARQAYGIDGSGASGYNPNICTWGSVGVGALSIAALVYLWWSLPR